MESIVMIVLMLAIMYFMLIRPENKRKKQAQEMRDSLKKGDVITTIGGIVGKIVFVGADTVVIETSEDRVRMELAKWAISTSSGQQSGKKAADDTSGEKGESAVEETEAIEESPVEELPAEEKPE